MRRASAALSLARSFLLLEDDYDVDWEVDQDEPGRGEQRAAYIGASAAGRQAPRRPSAAAHPHGKPMATHPHRTPSATHPHRTPSVTHPHRTPLRGSASARAARRTGQPAPKSQLCLCPVGSTSHARTEASARHPPNRTSPCGELRM